MAFEVQDPYEFEQRRDKWLNKGEFMLAKIFKVIFWFLKLVLTMTIGVLKGVLKTFGLPIKD